MKIKRYNAPSMRAALAQVRAEQGADAVILSSRRGGEGVEVIAAVDYDQALFADAHRQRSPAASTTPSDRQSSAAVQKRFEDAPPAALQPPLADAAPAAEVAPAAMEAPAADPASAASATGAGAPEQRADAAYLLMQRELLDMRSMLERGLAGMTWSDKRLRDPLQAQVLEDLSSMAVAPDVARTIAARSPLRTSLADPAHLPLALLVKHVPILDNLDELSGGAIALVGPTGAGKTTTIAKLAARWCLHHGPKDLALVSTDIYRVGAREQLYCYARTLDVPLHTADSAEELGEVLAELSGKRLILIDTAGMGPRDARLTEQLSALALGAARAKVLLTLPAHGESETLDEIVRAFATAAPTACIITKIDEAASLGGVLSAVIRHSLKVAYVCDGQRVPEDLHAAHQRRMWLARAAMQMKARLPRVVEPAYLSRHFGEVPAHA